ncbi:MAG: hypothetical protein P1V97_21555 [Planctomycetota bacterium]|nr:hypothetical protein [Planctomycetota bacterium]
MSNKDNSRERNNFSFRVREAYGWNKSELARRTRVHDKTVRRRESWDEEGDKWKQEITGEGLTLYELMLACKRVGLGWLVDRVTSGFYSPASLQDSMREKGVGPVPKLEGVLDSLKHLIDQLEGLPKEDQFMRNNSLQRLREAVLSLEHEVGKMKDIEDEGAPEDKSPP